MPYEPAPELLMKLKDEAMASPEISAKLEPIEWSMTQVDRFLAEREADIWSEVSSQIGAFNAAEKVTATEEVQTHEYEVAKPLIVRIYRDYLPAAGGFLIFGLLIAGFIALFSATERHWLVLLFGKWRLIASLIGSALAVWLIGTYFLFRQQSRQYDALRADLSKTLQAARDEKDRLAALIDPAVVASITGHLREFIEQRSKPAFSLDLEDSETYRLSEVPDPQFEIVTDSRRQVRTLLEKMNGGSIGVAGPRGCGKTTLLRSFCPDGNVNPKELTVFATAPVQYDPREFLLQLFTSICSQVLSKETKTDIQSSFSSMDSLREAAPQPSISAETVTALLLMASFFLLVIGTILGAVRVFESHLTPAVATAAGAVKPAATAPAVLHPDLLVLLNSDAFIYLVWGAAALFLGLVMQAIQGESVFSRILGLYTFRFRALSPRRRAAELQARSLQGVDEKIRPLVERATRTLRGLRFQQSYSSGWSGALKLPLGLEGGANAAMTLAERQLSLPEIVNEYRQFMRAAATVYDRIYVAIDEMDKLPSDEDAKKFLNGIKAVFGQEKIYYLISISENALSNFERRGLPIRDEFDSSFDDAVYLGYFDLASSRLLLARRSSTPPPPPFRAYCHVASGGLPRDLIRSCRKMYELRHSQNIPTGLAQLCTELIRKDIEAKIGALRSSLQQVADERRAGAVLAIVSIQDWSPQNLQDVLYKLHRAQSTLGEALATATPDTQDSLFAVINIQDELKAFLYFSLATMTIFQSIADEARFDQLASDKVFDKLAIARQLLAVNRVSAIERLNAILPLPLTV